MCLGSAHDPRARWPAWREKGAVGRTCRHAGVRLCGYQSNAHARSVATQNHEPLASDATGCIRLPMNPFSRGDLAHLARHRRGPRRDLAGHAGEDLHAVELAVAGFPDGHHTAIPNLHADRLARQPFGMQGWSDRPPAGRGFACGEPDPALWRFAGHAWRRTARASSAAQSALEVGPRRARRCTRRRRPGGIWHRTLSAPRCASPQPRQPCAWLGRR
jgi:hypothetical protein